jgi:hypothetical protein
MTRITLVINTEKRAAIGIFLFPSQKDLNREGKEMNPCPPQGEAEIRIKVLPFP